MVDVIPVSDPNAATMAQKIVTYQAVFQLSQSAPDLYNLPLLHRSMIEVLGVKDAAKLVPVEDDQVPTDPVQENQNLLTGKPVKAFIQQNHEAHIQVHMAAMQDPQIQELMANNPKAQAIGAAAMDHINEHIAFAYRTRIEQIMGYPLPTEEQTKNMPPEMAEQVAMLTMQAAQQLLQQNQQEAQQKKAQQQMQDPIVQMQQQELQLKMQEIKLKQEKQKIDAAAKADQLEIERDRIEAQKEIAAMQVSATAAAARDKLDRQTEVAGTKIGTDIAKHKAQMAVQMAQRAAQRNQPSKNPPKG